MVSKIDNLFTASRFVLPEQREAILQLKEDQKLVPQPILEEDELAEINFRIIDSIQYDYAVAIKWWRSTKGALGVYDQAWGWVKTIDHVAKRIKLVSDEDYWWIPMDKIVSIRQQ